MVRRPHAPPPRKEKAAHMKRLIQFFTRNWGLKLVALALALVVYFTMRNSPSADANPAHFFTNGAQGIEQNG